MHLALRKPPYSCLFAVAMLKPTGSAGGGSAATAAAQAAIADAVHNRAPTVPKIEEVRAHNTSFADEIGTKSRWSDQPPSQEGGARGRGGGRGGGGRGAGGRNGASAWDTNREGGRLSGRGGGVYERGERGVRDAFQDKDKINFRQSSDRNVSNNSRGREAIFGSGAHVGMANSSQEGGNGAVAKPPTTSYVRQHGPPPRKVAIRNAVSMSPPQEEHPPSTQQPTRSSAYSASTRSEYHSDADPWSTSTETSSKWRPSSSPSAQQPDDDPPEVSPTVNLLSPQSGTYVRTHGPPRRLDREGQDDGQGGNDMGSEASSRYKSPLGASGQGRCTTGRDSMENGDRSLSERRKESSGSLAPPPVPTNTRWKEPKDEPRTGARRWKGKEEGVMGSGRWGRSTEEDGDRESGGVAAAATGSPPPQSSSWKEARADDGWGLDVGSATRASSEKLEEQADGEGSTAHEPSSGVGVSVKISVNPANAATDSNGQSTIAEDTPPESSASFRESFVQQKPVQPVIRNASWEPQLPRGGDLWENPGHGRDNIPQNQGPGQPGPSGSGSTSQPWSDPWGTSGFGLSASGDQGSSAMASFLSNDPGEPRKERYLPPALRNRTPSEGNQGGPATVSPVDQEPETASTSLSQDVAAPDVSTQDLVMPGTGGRMGVGAASPGGTAAAKTPIYEQQEPLEEWQQGGTQQDQTGLPVEQQLHQRQPLHQSRQVKIL